MEVLTQISGGIMSIKLLDIVNMDRYEYAFYLYKDKERIQQIWYSASCSVEFELRGNGVFQVTAFMRDIETQEIVSVDSRPVRYFNGGTSAYIPFLFIEEMEMTNICNLTCQNCCTPTTKYPRGFIDDRTVLAALSWTQRGQTLNYHRQGEPLLHKELDKYIRWGVETGIKPIISTNGVLLDKKRLASLHHAGLRHLVITLHTQRSLESLLDAYQWFRSAQIELRPFTSRHDISLRGGDIFFFSGSMLDFDGSVKQSQDVRAAFQSMPEEVKEFIQLIPTHNWAGNVPHTRKTFPDDAIHTLQKNCYFIQKSVVNVRWDGTIVGCCFDSENDNALGHISDFANIRIDPSNYQLCKHCDNNWAVSKSSK